jgi:pyrroline-5-carboxylate reductase
MYKNVSFIGGGRITQLLLQNLKYNNVLPERVVVCDPDENVFQKLDSLDIPGLQYKKENQWEVSADLVFLSVHPPLVKEVLPQIKDQMTAGSVLISLVPVMKTAVIQQLLDGFDRIVRMIPNAPSIIGEGYNPVYFSASISENEKSDLLDLFNKWGKTPEVAEDKLEAYAILSAMGPTYFWFQWLELKKLGVEFNLTENETINALYEMINGSAQLLLKSDFPAEEVLDMIPVRPLQEEEENIRQIISNRLSVLYGKLTAKK